MKKRMKVMVSLLCVAIMCFGLAACGKDSSKSNTNSGKTSDSKRTDLNLLITDAFSTLDPHNLTLSGDIGMAQQIYEPLYWIGADHSEIPLLATEYSVSDDNLAWTFKLREGVKFQNGDELKASDVVYSYNRSIASSYMQRYMENIESAEATDDSTVVLHLSAPCAPLLSNLSHVGIANEKYVEENKDDQGLLGFNACGTGPYKYKESTPDVSVTLESNPDYWNGEPDIKKITYNLITDATTALTAFKSGEIDLTTLPAAEVESVVASGQFNTKVVATKHITYLILNSETEPFNNKALRQAIAYAIDNQAVIDIATGGTAAPASTIASPFMNAYPEEHTSYEYNKDKAKELLKEAGYPDSIDIGSIKTMGGSTFEKVAQVTQSQLAEVGITCTIEGLEGNALVNDCVTGNFTMSVMGYGLTEDYDYMKVFYNEEYLNGLNMARYIDPEITSLFKDGMATIDIDERKEIYQKVENLCQDACVYVPLYYLQNTYAWAKDLNFEPTNQDVLIKDLSWK